MNRTYFKIITNCASVLLGHSEYCKQPCVVRSSSLPTKQGDLQLAIPGRALIGYFQDPLNNVKRPFHKRPAPYNANLSFKHVFDAHSTPRGSICQCTCYVGVTEYRAVYTVTP